MLFVSSEALRGVSAQPDCRGPSLLQVLGAQEGSGEDRPLGDRGHGWKAAGLGVRPLHVLWQGAEREGGLPTLTRQQHCWVREHLWAGL